MTISSEVRKAGPFNGNDLTTSFPFTFKVFDKGDLRVVRTMPSGIEADLILDSDYSVALNPDQDATPGGTVTFPISGDPLAEDWKLTIVGDIDALQPTDLTNGGGFYPQVIENMSDRLTMQVQQLAEGLSRAVKVPVSSQTPPEDLLEDIKEDVASAHASALSAQESAAAAEESASRVDLGALDQAVEDSQQAQAAAEGARDVATTNAAIATTQANRSESEADRAESEADRADASAAIAQQIALFTSTSALDCKAAQTLALPASTYANGTLGAGATITADANGVMTTATYFDGVTINVGDTVLIRMEAAGRNWLYTLTQQGTGSLPWIFTRLAASDTAAEIGNAVTNVLPGGALYGGTKWRVDQAAGSITVGTTALTFSAQSAAVAAEAAARQAADAKILSKLGADLQDVVRTTAGTNAPNTTSAPTGNINAIAFDLPNASPIFSVATTLIDVGTGEIHIYTPTTTGTGFVWAASYTVSGVAGVNTYTDGIHFNTNGKSWPAGTRVGYRRLTGVNIRFDTVTAGTGDYSVTGDTGVVGASVTFGGSRSFRLGLSFTFDAVGLQAFPKISALSAAVAKAFGAAATSLPTAKVPVGAAAAPGGSSVSGVYSEIDALPVGRGGRLRSISYTGTAAGPVNITFSSRNADGTFTPRVDIPITTAVGENLRLADGVGFNVGGNPIYIEPTWHMGHYRGATAGGSGGIAFWGFGACYAANTAPQVENGAYTYTSSVTFSRSAEIDAEELAASRGDLTRNRQLIYREPFLGSALPDGWTAVGGGVWAVSDGVLTSPSGTAGYGVILRTNRYVRAENRITSVYFQLLTAGAIAGFGSRNLDGNVRAPSLITVDSSANTLNIKNAFTASSNPGTAASVTPSFTITTGRVYRLDILLNVREHTATLTDVLAGWQATVSQGNNAALTNPNPASGQQNDCFCFVNVAGQFSVGQTPASHSPLAIYSDRGPARVAAIGDSITQGDQVLAADRWAALLSGRLNGSVTVSAQGSSRSLGAYYTALTEIPAMRPNWLVIPIGTNDQDSNLASAQVFILNAVNIAKRYGTRVVLATFLTANGRTYTNFNAWVTSLAAADPDNIKIWRWDLAQTVNADGVTQDASQFNADLLHPNAAGHLALYNRLVLVDVPELLN